jgi:cephalosporin-C deacetylase
MPLTFDYAWDKLQTYMGINPLPADFDAYWDAALAEMHALGTQAELVPAEFQAPEAECFHLYFHGVGGSRVHAKYLRPKNSPGPHPAVVMFHGYSGSSGDWSDKLSYVGQGFSVAALDCRGQAGLSEDAGQVGGNTLNGHIIRGLWDALNGEPEKLLFRQIFLDTAHLARIVMAMPEVDSTRVGATGGSQGGALTVACAALEPGIKRLAPIHPFLSDYQRVWDMDQAKDAYAELKTFFRNFDPRHENEQKVFEMLGYVDIQHLARRIRGEVLWAIGLMDTICPPSSQFAAYNKITAPKSLAVYPDFGHEGMPGLNDKIFQFLLELKRPVTLPTNLLIPRHTPN